MKFKLLSDKSRRIHLDMDKINLYVSRYKPFTPFDFEIVRRVSKKSNPQRAYYFGVVIPTYAEALGYDPDDYYLFHCGLKFRYFEGLYSGQKDKQPYIDKNNVYRNVPALFADESEFDVEFKTKFIDWVIRRAIQKDGVYIPGSDE